uniref:YidC/Oxa1 family membrane protein insertase n=1 Tax=Agathobacter sp. TaxID=2021311 RepID=UPI00405626CF
MSLLDIIYTIFIGPLQLVFEVIYTVANRFIGHPGLAIIVLSLIMNFLVLPLYKRSDAMQEAARDIEEKLREGVTHIKKTFSGDEQMMILQTYYRQNNYKPTDALNGSVSLLLEVPFFMAAYQFLSHLQTIQGVSLGPIADLGAPDALISVGGISINFLPILMTLVNVVSSAIYLKGFPLKTKIQLYAMALFFLVFLYTSPSGLVFYWTLNNVFSLVKTLFYKLKNPKKVLSILFSAVGVAVLGYNLFIYQAPNMKREFFMLGLGIAFQAPVIITLLKEKIHFNRKNVELRNDRKIFILGALFLTVLVGVLIPSALIAASPQEFIDVAYFHNPIGYIVNSLCLAAGTFLVWMGVFYWLASPSGKALFDRLVWILCGITLVNYMFFGTDLGIISANLQYENGIDFKMFRMLLNLLILSVISCIMYFIIRKWKHLLSGVMLTGIIALAGMSGLNIMKIQEAAKEAEVIADEMSESMPHFTLSKTGKNVIVLMLDRGMGEYIPYLFDEKPELEKQFDGFTYYSNAVSFGRCTNFGAPALFGGYEYTPVEMNKRDNELLVDKHNEALKVMPVLFYKNGYDVTICDPPYANYQWIPDLSIYDEYPEMETYITEGRFGDTKSKEYEIESNQRNFFCFSIMKTMPLVLQETIYNNGNYNQAENAPEEQVYANQTLHSNTTSEGLSSKFMEPYNVLANLPNMTEISSDGTDTFLMMSNNTTHEPMMLQEPEYEPSQVVDNTKHYKEHGSRFTVNGVTLKAENSNQIIHYQANMAVMLQLGKWFDYMRENDVYDNTRIIIVSDHGRNLYHFDEFTLDGNAEETDTIENYYPLLLVKDFDSKGFTTSEEFMTNGDVPTMAVKDIIENPTNPFTGNPINNAEKTAHDQYVIISSVWDVNENNGYTYVPAKWWAVSEDMREKENWRLIDEKAVLPKEAAE